MISRSDNYQTKRTHGINISMCRAYTMKHNRPTWGWSCTIAFYMIPKFKTRTCSNPQWLHLDALASWLAMYRYCSSNALLNIQNDCYVFGEWSHLHFYRYAMTFSNYWNPHVCVRCYKSSDYIVKVS